MNDYSNELLTSAFIHSISIIFDEKHPPKKISQDIFVQTLRFTPVQHLTEDNVSNIISFIYKVTEDTTITANKQTSMNLSAQPENESKPFPATKA